MKIFGKKRRTSAGAETSDSPRSNKDDSNNTRDDSEEAPVTSYFDNLDGAEADGKTSSSNKKKDVVMDIDVLLKMEFESLNAKQRRLVKRHEQVQAPSTSNTDKTKAVNDKNENAEEKSSVDIAEESDSSDDDDSSDAESATSNDKKATAEEVRPVAPEVKGETVGVPPEIQDIANKDPKERNSKQRRQLKRYTDKHGEVARIVLAADGTIQEPVMKKRRRNGKSDVSSLSKEESQRREEQATIAREMQEKRNLGLVVSDGRHPLNSQRRRANRRKPGKAGMLAAAKRERKSKFQ